MSKANKRRLCPALGREISRGECGENRIGRYACPASCPHNPFALENYTALLTIEDVLDRMALDWMYEDAADPGRLKRGLADAIRADSGHDTHAFVTWHLFMRRDERGLTCAQRWAQAKFPGLNNDERVLIQAKMQVRVVLLEVHRVLDEQRLEAVDLLAPEAPPMIIVDRSLASRTSRFATLLGWAYPLPHFWRLSGTAIIMPDFGDFEAPEVVAETVRHLGGPTEIAAMRLWLAEHFVRVNAAFTATATERHRLMLASVDAQFGLALYAPQASFAECRAALDAEPEIDRDEPTKNERDEGFAEARDWFDDKSPTMAGRKLLGRILLGQAFWKLEATGAARLAELRSRFEKRLGKRMRFDRERLDDVGARLMMDMPQSDRASVPPRLVERPMQVEFSTSRVQVPTPQGSKADIEAHFMRDYLRDYADHPVPALEGKTPRQAAAIPALRTKLISLLKPMVQRIDEANLRTGRSDDINGLLRNLGLAEIDFPPPPRRARPPEVQADDDDFPEDFEPNRVTARAALHPLPPGPLSEEEVKNRMRAALTGFETAAAAMDELLASGATLLEDVGSLTEGLLSENEYSFLISFLIHGWFTLVPPRTRAPKLDYETMVAELERELERVPSWVAGGPEETMDNVTSGCRQPALLQFLFAEMVEASTAAPKNLRPRPEAMIPMIAVLKVTINEVDRALREV
ncbi:hypothetical protein GALL_359350 [mine drainage metagenome]|uniref:Uncharacterized protein n=1 Tax=mine drainage metagenome TaxID=410659 RepID=A0A1J5QQT1_9ZZZZ